MFRCLHSEFVLKMSRTSSAKLSTVSLFDVVANLDSLHLLQRRRYHFSFYFTDSSTTKATQRTFYGPLGVLPVRATFFCRHLVLFGAFGTVSQCGCADPAQLDFLPLVVMKLRVCCQSRKLTPRQPGKPPQRNNDVISPTVATSSVVF
jgi:hypothetical protein